MSNLTVQCPTCQTPVIWCADSKFRPFCSDRCRLIDLGEWASDSRVIPDTRPIETGLGDADLAARDIAVERGAVFDGAEEPAGGTAAAFGKLPDASAAGGDRGELARDIQGVDHDQHGDDDRDEDHRRVRPSTAMAEARAGSSFIGEECRGEPPASEPQRLR